MVKVIRACSFTNATITCENGVWEITDLDKDAVKTYELAEVLSHFKDIIGVSFQIKYEDEYPENEEEEKEAAK